MKNLTTPQAVLGGLALIALAVASIPYSSSIVTPAHANEDRVQKVAICNLKPTVTPIYQTKPEGYYCADVVKLASPHGKKHDVHMLVTYHYSSDHYEEKLRELHSRYIKVRDLLQKCLSR